MMESPTEIPLPAVPLLILALGIVIETVRFVGRPGGPIQRGFDWFMRPWCAWAVFSLVFRWNWERGFNNRRTFPFFANLWEANESLLAAVSRLSRMPSVWIWGAVVVVLLTVILIVIAGTLRNDDGNRRKIAIGLIAIYFLMIGMHLSAACLPAGAGLKTEAKGSLLSCWQAHSTMLYAVPYVVSPSAYLRDFISLQPHLRKTIHALSHPPGASLSMYWIGKLAGAERKNIRLDSTRIRYAVGLTAFSGLSLFTMYFLGRVLFRSHRTGAATAGLWLCAPSVIAYNTFAQDGAYAVFFIASLLQIWNVVTNERTNVVYIVLLGINFFILTMLNYSWCIVTTIFVVFLLFVAVQRRWSIRDYLWRGVVPLGIMTVLAASVMAIYRLNYWTMYVNSREYVDLWYRFENTYQHVTAFIGGQLDILLMLGSVTVSAFLVTILGLRRTGIKQTRVVFLLVIIGISALPILFGPSCLRMETARCWNWVTAVPLAFAAHKLLSMDRPNIFYFSAAGSAALTYMAMRLFMNFAP